MEPVLDTLTQLDIDIDEWYNAQLECGVGYDSCVQVAVWISDGCCPNCSASSPGRLICGACKASIDAGRSMIHKTCNYRGKGADFFKSFRAL